MIDRRLSKRRPIVESFAVFVVIPRKGWLRLPIYDLSETGIGFDADADGESPADFPIEPGEVMDFHLYLNQSLYLPLSLKVTRVEKRQSIRKVGAELLSRNKPEFEAYLAFLQMLDKIVESAKFTA